MKVLGTHIGDDIYVVDKIDMYIAKIKSTSDKLINYQRNQERFLLLYYCYVPLIDHYLKTIPSYLTYNLCSTFENCKRSIIASCLKQNILANSNAFIQSRFSISSGGLGLRFSNIVRHSAFVASTITVYDELIKCNQNIDYTKDPFFQSFRDSLNEILLTQSINNDDSNSKLITVENIMNTKQNKSQKLQAKFTEMLTNNKYNSFIASISDHKYLTLLTSLNDNSCGKFLETIPKDPKFEFNNNEFSALLSYRLFLSQPLYVENTHCSCHQKSILDPTGLHLSTCPKEGTLFVIHDNMIDEFNNIFRMYGYRTKVEPTQCFNNIDNNLSNNNKNINNTKYNRIHFNNKRSDIQVYNPPTKYLESNTRELLFDYSNTTIFEGTKSGIIQNVSYYSATTPFHYGYQAYKSKNRKYKQEAEANGYSFLPIIMESPSGRLDEKSKEVLKEFAINGSDHLDLDPSILYNYFLKRISCTYQKNLARCFVSRTARINGKISSSNLSLNYTLKHSFISKFHDVFINENLI